MLCDDPSPEYCSGKISFVLPLLGQQNAARALYDLVLDTRLLGIVRSCVDLNDQCRYVDADVYLPPFGAPSVVVHRRYGTIHDTDDLSDISNISPDSDDVVASIAGDDIGTNVLTEDNAHLTDEKISRWASEEPVELPQLSNVEEHCSEASALSFLSFVRKKIKRSEGFAKTSPVEKPRKLVGVRSSLELLRRDGKPEDLAVEIFINAVLRTKLFCNELECGLRRLGIEPAMHSA